MKIICTILTISELTKHLKSCKRTRELAQYNVKSMYCSCRGSEFGCQHPHQAAQTALAHPPGHINKKKNIFVLKTCKTTELFKLG